MLGLIQPKDIHCVSSREKPSLKDKGEKDRGAVNGDGIGEHEGKPQHEKTDEKNHLLSHTGVIKSGPVNVSPQPAVEKTSPLVSPDVGKLTYNPITHAPSMSECFLQVTWLDVKP